MSGNNIRRNHVGDKRACSGCGGNIVVTESMVRARTYRCSACHVRTSRAWTERNREHKRRLNAAYLSKHPDKRAQKTARWRQQHPEAYAAHTAVHTALRRGDISRQACMSCGATNTHAHHEDYSRKLDVAWLCHPCHMSHHSMLEARKR